LARRSFAAGAALWRRIGPRLARPMLAADESTRAGTAATGSRKRLRRSRLRPEFSDYPRACATAASSIDSPHACRRTELCNSMAAPESGVPMWKPEHRVARIVAGCDTRAIWRMPVGAYRTADRPAKRGLARGDERSSPGAMNVREVPILLRSHSVPAIRRLAWGSRIGRLALSV
jgi:hypothetical protein